MVRSLGLFFGACSGVALFGCGVADGDPTPTAAGGQSAVGGTAVQGSSSVTSSSQAGGSMSTGGSVFSTGYGGSPASGGANSSARSSVQGGAVGIGSSTANGGGIASGGTARGGNTNGEATSKGGRTSSGGSATGGAATGGTSSKGGGTSTGGTATGGTVATGGSSGGTSATFTKPRVINTTDLVADPDDEQSMVRQLVYADWFDLEGLVVTTGCWRKTQDANGKARLDKIVNAYGQVVANLKLHSPDFPSLDHMKSISVMGQTGYSMGAVGAGKDSAGSNLIIAAVDKPDPRPVWVTCWGGCNTVAQAIWKVQSERSATELQAFLKKLRVYDILGQDEAAAWMAHTFPDDLLIIRARDLVYGWQPTDAWVNDNVQNHGALGAVYPEKAYVYEGDSPAFLHLIPNGLHDPSVPDQGGWGGRFGPQKACGVGAMEPVTGQGTYNAYCMYTDAAEGKASISRWKSAMENDFAARMDWTTKNTYAGANHHPIAVVNSDSTRDVLTVSAAAGSNVALSAAGSTDPDSNTLTYAWSFYDEPSSHNGAVTIQGANTESATVAVPAGASGKNLHIILTLSDNGTPSLVAYRRVIINVQ